MTGPVGAEELRQAQALSTALAKLPPFAGSVWRGAPVPQQLAAGYTAGDVVVEPAFVSATWDPAVFFPAAEVLYVIASHTGRDISALSQTPADAEVVFDRGSMFLVLAVTRTGGVATVYLDEVPAEPSRWPPGGAALARLERLRADEAARLAVPAAARRPTSSPGKYAFPVGMSDQGEPRRVVPRP